MKLKSQVHDLKIKIKAKLDLRELQIDPFYLQKRWICGFVNYYLKHLFLRDFVLKLLSMIWMNYIFECTLHLIRSISNRKKEIVLQMKHEITYFVFSLQKYKLILLRYHMQPHVFKTRIKKIVRIIQNKCQLSIFILNDLFLHKLTRF